MVSDRDMDTVVGNALSVGSQPSTDIPFEVVDDDEMAAIESAFLHAQAISSAYHSFKNAEVHVGLNLKNSVVKTPPIRNVAGDVHWNPTKDCVVYTVTSSFSAGAGLSALRNTGWSILSGLGEEVCTSGIQASEDVESQLKSQTVDMPESDAISTCVSGVSGILSQAANRTSTRIQESQESVLLSASLDSQSTLIPDIEDTCGPIQVEPGVLEKHSPSRPVSLPNRARHRLSVTDITASEWCEKQVEFSMTRGKPESTPAMKAGSARHVQLEVEVVTRVEVEIRTREDSWATRLLNFISGSRQLLTEGITRELPVIGVIAGTWVVGIIDELRLVESDGQEYPFLVDTKTRRRKNPPAEPQKRNARLQLMSYKYLWDSIVETGISSEIFFQHFKLRPHQKFCSDVRNLASTFYRDDEIKCFQDLLPQFNIEIRNYPKSLDTLLLRYEWQADQSLLGQDEFDFDQEWLKDRWTYHLQFWKGQRVAVGVTEDETWKCRHCSFAPICKSDESFNRESS